MSIATPSLRTLALSLGAFAVASCASSSSSTEAGPTPAPAVSGANMSPTPPSPDPRIGLRAGMTDAEEAVWNLRRVSTTPPTGQFAGVTNSDLAFLGNYAIQGNYNGFQVWDISNPARPTLRTGYFCPASQSDVSVYRNLLFVSGEGLSGRLDCAGGGVPDSVSADRLRGLRIFDISDIANPRNVGNVQTCRGSHTHSVLVDPKDPANVYVYISGSAGVRSPSELPGCSSAAPEEDPNSALFRIEVIKVPLANPSAAAIVSSPRIFNDLAAPPTHGDSPADRDRRERQLAQARARGAFVVDVQGTPTVLPDRFAMNMLDSVVKARNGTGAPTSADSAALRAALPQIVALLTGGNRGPRRGPTQCHDITLYPAIGLAGGACGGYGLLIDISDPANPRRIDAVADSNFSYWHSATFNNDGTKLLFSDEWGGGGQPKCRADDPKEWGADAIFTISANRKLDFKSYYKMPAAQTELENCVAHNGSLIPIPGRDVMVQAWYQGGISVFDWTDPSHPVEIAFHDRGPSDSTQMGPGGSWSVYWYNGEIVSSEIARGLDIFELVPSYWLSKNEIDAARSVKMEYLNTQGQPKFTWPASFALSRAYVDQLERSKGMTADEVAAARKALNEAEGRSGAARSSALNALATTVGGGNGAAGAKRAMLAQSLRDLAGSR